MKLAPRAANDFRDTLAIGSALFARGDWKYVAGEAPAELLWLIGPEAIERYDRLRPEPPKEISRGFIPSGYFVMRDGWRRDSSFVLVDCGPHGAEIGCGHAHSDALSIEFAARGVAWIVDPGSYVYASDAKTRDEFRSTAAHNTVTVDDEPQSMPSTPFRWRSVAKCHLHNFIDRDDAIFFQGSHDGYDRLNDPVNHMRTVLLVKADSNAGLPEHLVIRDRFIAKKRHRYAIPYHLTYDSEAWARDSRVEARHFSGAELTISVFYETGIKTEILSLAKAGVARMSAKVSTKVPGKVTAKVVEGRVSTCYARYSPAPIALFEAEGEGTHEFLTLILPGSFDQMEEVERRILRLRRAGATPLGWRGLEIMKVPGSGV